MKEIEDIDSFMNRVMIVVNQLKIYGEEIKDQTVAEKVLRSLSTKFDVVVAAIEEAKDLASLTVEKLVRKKIANQGNQRPNVTTKSTNSMFLACHTMHEPSDNVWLLDSDCSNHMTSNKNLVANLDQSVKTKVKLGTDKTMDVNGERVVNILTKQGELKTISMVYYVPDLKHNLISVG
eukprot:PITA_16100